ncbi:MAG: lysophospholipid acyltransferase family protein [Campylobacterota bacterium]|nr:lysophospholipid acyltransferase family protein [Campylobacterota bacterium]
MSLKKRLFTFLQLNVVPYLLQLFVKFIYLTNKKKFHYPKADLQNENFVIAFWHGDLLMQPHNFAKFKPKGLMKAIISEHRDGEAIRRVVEHLGVLSFSGSSTRGGAKAMIGAIKALKNKEADVAITPDGPKGPIYSVADGIVAIAQKTKTRVIPFSTIPSKYWQLKSWDKFIIPKPFGSINFYVGEPFDLNDLELEDAKKLIYDKMMENQLKK